MTRAEIFCWQTKNNLTQSNSIFYGEEFTYMKRRE